MRLHYIVIAWVYFFVNILTIGEIMSHYVTKTEFLCENEDVLMAALRAVPRGNYPSKCQSSWMAGFVPARSGYRCAIS